MVRKFPIKTKKRKPYQGKKRDPHRPTKLDEGMRKFILYLTKQGHTVSEIAKITEITPASIYGWQRINPAFLKSIKEARSDIDDMVEAAVFQAAVGYSLPETKRLVVNDGMESGSHVETFQDIKHYPPNDRLAKFWLINRQPEKWRERIDVDLIKKYAAMTEEEMLEEIRKMGYLIQKADQPIIISDEIEEDEWST